MVTETVVEGAGGFVVLVRVVVVVACVVEVGVDVVVVPGAEPVVEGSVGVVDVESGIVVSATSSAGSSPVKLKRKTRPIPRVTVRPIAAIANLFIGPGYFLS
ncbi:MAG TPA: hypothetical protein VIW94_09540 [Acidimicrobiia bacterium]